MSTSTAPDYVQSKKLSSVQSDTETAIHHNAGPSTAQPPLIKSQPGRTAGMQVSYAQEWEAQNPEGFYANMIHSIGGFMGALGSIPCCFCCPSPYKSISQGTVGLVSKFGQLQRSVDPGLVKLNPLSENLRVVDVKIQIADVGRQTVMTRDNVSVAIDSVIVYHIDQPARAAFGVSDVKVALIERAQTTLRSVVGSRNLQALLTDREAVAAEIESIIEGISARWGVSVESILIKDINFSASLMDSLSSAATQRRLAEAKVIAAQAEVDSARLFREAADILNSPAALQIRQIEGMIQMAGKAGSKVIFMPMPAMSATGASGSGDGSGVHNAAHFNQLEQLANNN